VSRQTEHSSKSSKPLLSMVCATWRARSCHAWLLIFFEEVGVDEWHVLSMTNAQMIEVDVVNGACLAWFSKGE